VIFLEVTEKECVKERYPHFVVKNHIVQHCAAMSTIVEFSFVFPSVAALILRTLMVHCVLKKLQPSMYICHLESY